MDWQRRAADADAAIGAAAKDFKIDCVAADRIVAVTTWGQTMTPRDESIRTFQDATDGQDCKFRDTDAELRVRLAGRDTV